MSAYSADAIIVGAGVIGLSVARKLARLGLETIILEQSEAIGTGTSSRNSEVIHAGLYYPRGSIKARCCVEGRHALYAYCNERHVDVKRIGKILLAADEAEVPKLSSIGEAAKQNGVLDLVSLSQTDMAGLEPEVVCVTALFSPSTGIIDSHGYMQALRADFEAAGGVIAFQTPVVALKSVSPALIVFTGGVEPTEINARFVINAAGHGAPRLAAQTTGMAEANVPRQWYAKGNYFSLIGRQPFKHLVYPMPDQAGLGVHATIDLNGRCRFGPDVEWVEDDRSMDVNPARAAKFYASIRRYWPALQDGSLQPDYAGIRPKIHDWNSPMPDFRVDGPRRHGVQGLVNLFGIESPGLTASLSIAHMVAEELGLVSKSESIF